MQWAWPKKLHTHHEGGPAGRVWERRSANQVEFGWSSTKISSDSAKERTQPLPIPSPSIYIYIYIEREREREMLS